MARLLTLMCVIALLGVVGYRQYGIPVEGERSAIEKGINSVKNSKDLSAENEQILRVQLAIQDYFAKNGDFPRSLNVLVPVYFDSIPMDPRTGTPLKYKYDNNKYLLGDEVENNSRLVKAGSKAGADANVQKVALTGDKSPEDYVNPNTMKEETFVYDANGKRDPFRPFDLSGKPKLTGPLKPLQRYSIKQLRFTAVINAPDGNLLGTVEDASGRGYIVRKGTLIGDAGGSVVKVEKDKLHIIETRVDLTGKEHRKVIEMKIARGPVNHSKKKR